MAASPRVDWGLVDARPSGECRTLKLSLLIVTDADGSLLEAESYSFQAAAHALAALERWSVPLILCSSKTAAELVDLQRQLGITHPFISENGGSLHVPDGYFPFPIPRSERVNGFDVLSLGRPYTEVAAALRRVADGLGIPVSGFNDLSVAEIATLCGLSPATASLAKRRAYDEPFRLIDPVAGAELRLVHALGAEGIHVVAGGRFHHAVGDADKGVATTILRHLYRKAWGPVTTVGLGDALNDVPLLRVVDVPVIVRGATSTSATLGVQHEVPWARVTKSRGPAGWAEAVQEIIDERTRVWCGERTAHDSGAREASPRASKD